MASNENGAMLGGHGGDRKREDVREDRDRNPTLNTHGRDYDLVRLRGLLEIRHTCHQRYGQGLGRLVI